MNLTTNASTLFYYLHFLCIQTSIVIIQGTFPLSSTAFIPLLHLLAHIYVYSLNVITCISIEILNVISCNKFPAFANKPPKS